jgi:hypothetical protein
MPISRWNRDEGDAALIIPAGDASVPTPRPRHPRPYGERLPGTLGIKRSREAARVGGLPAFSRYQN